jgi:hypothetical protein
MPYAPATRIFSVNAHPTCAHVVRGGCAMTLPGLPDEARRPVLSPLTGRPFELTPVIHEDREPTSVS